MPICDVSNRPNSEFDNVSMLNIIKRDVVQYFMIVKVLLFLYKLQVWCLFYSLLFLFLTILR